VAKRSHRQPADSVVEPCNADKKGTRQLGSPRTKKAVELFDRIYYLPTRATVS